MTYVRNNSIRSAVAMVFAVTAVTQANAPVIAQTSVGVAPPAVSAAADPILRMEQARSSAEDGRFDEALAQYMVAAEEQVALGELPTDAMWQVAEIYYGQENYRSAAQVLSELSSAAAAHGDQVVQARSLLEATILYKQIGELPMARRAAVRLKQLRASAELPEDLRTAIDTRVHL